MKQIWKILLLKEKIKVKFISQEKLIMVSKFFSIKLKMIPNQLVVHKVLNKQKDLKIIYLRKNKKKINFKLLCKILLDKINWEKIKLQSILKVVLLKIKNIRFKRHKNMLKQIILNLSKYLGKDQQFYWFMTWKLLIIRQLKITQCLFWNLLHMKNQYLCDKVNKNQ